MEAPANEERLLAVRPDREGDFLFGAELAHVLRGRLVLLCLIILATAAIELVFIQLQADRFDWAMTDRNLALTVLTLYLLPLGLLWRRRDLSLHTLRLVETAIFMGAAAFLGIGEYLWYRSGWLEVIAQPGQEANFMEVLGDSLSLPWFALIVFYGVCIPSTGRQCARVVAALDLAAVALFLAIYDVDDPLAPMMSQTLPIKLFFWLSLASAVAVYGSQKLSELRREAFEARRLGQYTLKELLGKGGMGEVYLAEHKLLKRPCALKLIRPESAGHARVLERFEREVQATAALTHPNVVEIYDYGHADDGTFYYVMELLRGMNLAEMVEKHGPLPSARVAFLLRQVCGVLHEAHGSGLVHRDIKPSNIIVCERGRVHDVAKLVDFGLVRAAQNEAATAKLTVSGMIVGTPPYMSPEQIQGKPLDGRSDVYSLGVVAYFLLTGVSPFRRATARETFSAHLLETVTEPILLSPLVEPDLNRLVMRCLEKDPAARFGDALQCQKALDSCTRALPWTTEQAEAWWQQVEQRTSAER